MTALIPVGTSARLADIGLRPLALRFSIRFVENGIIAGVPAQV